MSADGSDQDDQTEMDEDEKILEKKIKQLLVGNVESDPDDEIIKRKIKERLDHSVEPQGSHMPSRSGAASRGDLFSESDDDASSESTQPQLNRADRRRCRRSRDHSSSSDSDVTARERTRVRVRRPDAGKVAAAEKVYDELEIIHTKLKVESAALKRKELTLTLRENKLRQAEEMYTEILECEKRECVQDIEERYQRDLDALNELYREKCRENKRLRENFEAIKSTNEALKCQLETLTGRHEKLERQSSSLQSRLSNLQRIRSTQENRPKSPVIITTSNDERESEVKPKVKVKTPAAVTEVLTVLLEWLAESQLKEVTRSALSTRSSSTCGADVITGSASSGAEDEHVGDASVERAMKVLPHLADLLRDGLPQGGRVDLPCLQFVYWSLYKMDQTSGMYRSSLTSTLRRLGEELYRSKSISFHEKDAPSDLCDKPRTKDGRYFSSYDLQERFLSCLIILKTLSQADTVANVLDTLKFDLKDNLCKDMFVHYRAMTILLNFFKPANQSLLSSTCDILLQLCMECRLLEDFLRSCSTDAWFRQCSVVLRSPVVDRKVVEKLSIVLQKLSKIKSNRRLLETYGISSAVQDLLRDCGDEDAFLALNLKSIQYNLLQKS